MDLNQYLLAWQSHVVPCADYWFRIGVVLVTEYAHAGRTTVKESSLGCHQSKPARRDHANDMTARKCQNIAANGPDPSNEPIGSAGDIIRGFPVWAAIAVKLPTGMIFEDFGRGFSFEGAVIPFEKIGVDLCSFSIAGQLTRLESSLERARKNTDEGILLQTVAKLARVPFASLVQRQVGPSRVLTGIRPGRVSMSGKK